MNKKKDFIVVTVRSFIPPAEPVAGYDLGKAFKMKLPTGTTLQELAQNILSKNVNQMGIMAVNSRLAAPEMILSDGDQVDLYALFEGG